jgi:hypothetical protein
VAVVPDFLEPAGEVLEGAAVGHIINQNGHDDARSGQGYFL